MKAVTPIGFRRYLLEGVEKGNNILGAHLGSP